MASNALASLDERLKDIDQLLEAHSALTKFKRAEQSAKNAGADLSKIADVVKKLVTAPGKGRPAEVEAINKAAFVLLMSHFQGFVDDLHREAANKLLKGKVDDVDELIKLVKPRSANPHPEIIEQMFSGLGIHDVMSSINWQKTSNKKVKSRLKGYIETRNKIAHGAEVKIKKQKVKQFQQFVNLLSTKIDAAVPASAQKFVGSVP